jgi:hypothetical protein
MPQIPKKYCLGPQNDPKSLGPKKLPKNCQGRKLFFEPVGLAGWPPISTRINPPSLGSNGIHCVEFLGDRGKCLLNLNLAKLFSLMEKLRYLAC